MDEEIETLLDMNVGQSLLMATVLNLFCEEALIDKASLLEAMKTSLAKMKLNEGQAWPMMAVIHALGGRPAQQEGAQAKRAHLVLVQ
jgi:hypothetical protein